MSVKTTVSAGAMSPELLCEGIERYLKDTLLAQELVSSDCEVSLAKGEGVVSMHGSESAMANYGVVSFSDTPYQIGISEKDGEVSFVFDSWVNGGSLRKRVDGKGEQGKGANLSQCEMLERARKYANSRGRSFGVEFMKEGGAKAFVPHI